MFGLHCAYSVTVSPCLASIFDPFAPSSYESPEPSGSVFHDANVCAANENALVLSLAVPPYVNSWSAISPVADSSFLSKCTL